MNEKLRPVVDLPHCLSQIELDYFVALIDVPVDRIGSILVVVHANIGPVAWLWDETLSRYCLGVIN